MTAPTTAATPPDETAPAVARAAVCAFCSRVIPEPERPKCCAESRLFRYHYIGGRKNEPISARQNAQT